MRIYGGSDYAVTADGGDYTVHFVVGLDPEVGASSLHRTIEAFCDLVLEWKPMGWAEEKGQISAGVGPALNRRQRERKAYCYRQCQSFDFFPALGHASVTLTLDRYSHLFPSGGNGEELDVAELAIVQA